jgi:hypothetical protein
VTVFDHLPAPARKFLMAGRGGLNLTHSEPLPALLDRYGAARGRLAPAIEAFAPQTLIAWCEGLGEPTFIGTSGRVFPRKLKASPLLRAWLRRLEGLGVRLAPRHRLTGLDRDGTLHFGATRVQADAVVLALGGASWPQLGSDGGWAAWLDAPITPFAPANCGVRIGWSAHLLARAAGQPLKRIAVSAGNTHVRGEAVITRAGLGGGAIYALAPALRAGAPLLLDLRPDLSAEEVVSRVADPAGLSLANLLRRRLSLAPAAIALVQEARHRGWISNPVALKAIPLPVDGPMGLDRAISSAGGIAWEAVGEDLALAGYRGVFVAGEMLDWEAPTGGYLLQACFSTGVAAAKGALSRAAAAGS